MHLTLSSRIGRDAAPEKRSASGSEVPIFDRVARGPTRHTTPWSMRHTDHAAAGERLR